MTRLRQRFVPVFAVCSLALLMLTGCGGGDSAKVAEPQAEPASDANDQPTDPAPASAAAPTNSAPGASAADGNLVQKRAGTTWIGQIPLDVWYDDPIGVASTAGQVAPPTEVANTTPMTTPMETPAEPMPKPMPASSGGPDWKRIIPAELLDAEVTTIRNRFNADLQNVGSYNRSYLAIPPHAAALSALAHIAGKHPGDIRWKENAKYIKHLAGKMNEEKLRQGASSQKPLKEKFDSIVEILSGSVPATLEAPPDNEPISELVAMGLIMKRLETGSKNIKVDGGSADAMKSNAEKIKQEAAVMGALTQVLLDGYGFEGDDGFAKYVKAMVEATEEVQDSVQNDQFDKFDLAVSKIYQACQQCHSDYRG